MHRITVFAVVGVLTAALSACGTPVQTVPSGGSPPSSAAPPGAVPNEAWAWTQLTSRGTQIRYVTTDTTQTCPSVRYSLAGSSNLVQLHRVSVPMGAQFPTTVCELGLALGASNAVLDQSTIQAATVHPANRQLPLPNWTATTRPRTIGVIGDTGCRVPTAGAAQDCANHQSGWPFPQIANSAATVSRPDLVIHVGDYLYRDDPGKENDMAANPGCVRYEDRASWSCVVADFFRPAETLLAAAPIALTRGNHEDCNASQMGGAGGAWFRYLADDLRMNGSCSEYTNPPAAIRAGILNLVSVDSSFADPSDDGTVTTAQKDQYTAQFAAVNQDAQQHPTHDYFVFTHKPLWMVKGAGSTTGAVDWATHVLDAAVTNTSLGRLADNIRLVLSGHIHLYQMVAFNTLRPPQVTVGSSGGAPLANGPDDSKVIGQPVGSRPQVVTQSITHGGTFGYAVLRDNGGTWDLTSHDRTGAVRGPTCTLDRSLTNKKFTCHT
ncbi:metallophosphoesterase [Embleya sp. NBC_00896]|uniref:metallophosphoesterase family protein n=1 Tax=Embleya sp. NBC_00896 TaxID=2975961 RepID=UPI00386ECECC|nr:metallophosphoesterase [Embleya sp. NBC_00896]